MGQYVMALLQQLIVHLRRPSHCRAVPVTELMLAEMLRSAAAETIVAAVVFGGGASKGSSGRRRCMCGAGPERGSSYSPARRRLVACMRDKGEVPPSTFAYASAESRRNRVWHSAPTHCNRKDTKELSIDVRTCAFMHGEPHLAKTCW